MIQHQKNPLRIGLLAFALLGAAVAASPVAQAATFVVVNNDAAGEGFNDPTAAAPVGGNSGTTIGAQRLIAFQHAADIWGGLLNSAVPIRVQAQFNPLSCTANSAVLGSAGPNNGFINFTGAPVANTIYAVALANALHGSDLDPGNDDINATFNSNIGTPGCLTSSGWYYGLDGNTPANRIDFVSVLLHELGHGLGFLTFVNLATGAKNSGFDDAYMRFLENHGASPPDYPSMSDAQRVAASIATGNLHWTGTNVRAASGVLSAGKVGDHVQMFAPNPQQQGSSVSHWDTALTPNQVMEPSYTGPLHNPVLELPLFQDMGWTLTAGATPSLVVSPASNISSSGNVGGPFSPSSFQYQLSSTTGSVNFSITGTPTWLTASFTSGTATTSPLTLTFTVNATANGLAVGTYGPTTITFTNTTNGQGNTTRTATLTVNAAGTATLVVTPGTNVTASGPQGGPFLPASFSYQVSTDTGSANFTVATNQPNVLAVSPSFGTATTTPQAVTFTLDQGTVNTFAPGAYVAPLTFTNTTSGQGNTTRTATVTVNSNGGAPSNNNFANARTIHLNETVTGVNGGASKESGEPNLSFNGGGKSVWWNYLAPSTGPVLVTTAGSSFNTILGVFTGNAVNALTLIAEDDDGGGNLTSQATFNATAGTTYRIMVDGFNGASGNIQLRLQDNSAGQATFVVSAVSPNARTTTVNGTVTAFASIINGGAVTATSCSIALPAGYPGTLTYQTTNPANNQPTGSPNTPTNINAGATQTFVFGVTPNAVTSQEIPLVFDCTNTNPTTVIPGLNTFLVSAANVALPDLLSIAATQAGGGIMDLSTPSSASVVATASVNISAAGTVTFIATDTAIGQLPKDLPVSPLICQTDPTDGHCINPATPAASASVTVAANQTVYFTAFVNGQGTFVPFDPANNRIFVIAYSGSTPVGEASAAIRMLSGGP